MKNLLRTIVVMIITLFALVAVATTVKAQNYGAELIANEQMADFFQYGSEYNGFSAMSTKDLQKIANGLNDMDDVEYSILGLLPGETLDCTYSGSNCSIISVVKKNGSKYAAVISRKDDFQFDLWFCYYDK